MEEYLIRKKQIKINETKAYYFSFNMPEKIISDSGK